MSDEKTTHVLVEALRQAQAETGEQRLYRSGKLAGLFGSRSGINAEAAARALREGLLEVTRTETRGKTTIEWVKPTPRCVPFLHAQQSPAHALEDLKAAVETVRAGLPAWQIEMQNLLNQLGRKLSEETQQLVQRLDTLTERVDRALKHLADAPPTLPNGVVTTMPWAADALTYLDQRRQTNSNGPCPFPELFAALREKEPELSVNGFQQTLRGLHERRALKLLPFRGPADELPQPEFALFDDGVVLYYAER